MGENFQVFTFFCQFKNSLCYEVIDFECFVQWIIEVYRCSTIDDDVNIINNELSLFWRDS